MRPIIAMSPLYAGISVPVERQEPVVRTLSGIALALTFERNGAAEGTVVRSEQIAGGYRVSGRVQGVGFRYWVVNQAERLGLSGYVRNTREGTVEVFAAGAESSLSALADALRQGPAGARVTAVDSLPLPSDPLPFPFEIRR